jgi:hypothetical protein
MKLRFYKLTEKLPEDSDWIVMKIKEYSPSGFVIGSFNEGFKTEDNQDITEDVLKWAYLPDYGLT